MRRGTRGPGDRPRLRTRFEAGARACGLGHAAGRWPGGRRLAALADGHTRSRCPDGGGRCALRRGAGGRRRLCRQRTEHRHRSCVFAAPQALAAPAEPAGPRRPRDGGRTRARALRGGRLRPRLGGPEHRVRAARRPLGLPALDAGAARRRRRGDREREALRRRRCRGTGTPRDGRLRIRPRPAAAGRSSPVPRPREHLGAAALGSTVYAVAGRTAGLDSNTDLFESYDAAANRWRALPRVPGTRGGTAAASVAGRIVSAGGEEPGGTIRTVFAYNPGTRRWTQLASLPRPRHGLGLVGYRGRAFALAGGPQPGLTVSSSTQVLALRR